MKRDPLDDLLGDLREPQPHIAEPDTRTIRDGTMCWRDAKRCCGSDCVAWSVDADPGSPDRCTILLYENQVAMAQVNMARAYIDLLKQPRPTADTNLFPPPPPIHRKTP
jgi:hypothetical protein